MRLRNIWRSYKDLITKNCTNPESVPTDSVYWQNRLFAATIVYLLPLSFIAIIPGAYMSYTVGLWGMIIVDAFLIGALFFIAFSQNVPVIKKKLLFNGTLYAGSLMLLIYLGSFGPGLLYLFATTIFILLTQNKIYGYYAVGLNIVISIGVAIWIYSDYYNFGIAVDQTLGAWIAVSANLIILSASAVFLIPILFESLQSALIKEKKLRSKIENDQRWLRVLESAFENTSEAIAILDSRKSENLLLEVSYVNDAFERITGYSREEILSKSLQKLAGPESDKNEIEKAWKVANERNFFHTEIIIYRKNNEKFWSSLSISPVKDNGEDHDYLICLLQDITKRKEREKKLKESLQEKETLLMEIHHRVKNNLAVVSSMMQLQAMEEQNSSFREKLYDSIFRIRTMVTIHELLYQSMSFSKIDFSENLKKLIATIVDTFQSQPTVDVDLQCDPITLNVNQAIPLSLIVNEVITNAFKHAFPNRKNGKIVVDIQEVNGKVNLKITDNGRGLPEDFDPGNTGSLGIRLIDVLSQQMDTSFEYENVEEGGTVFQINIYKSEVKGVGNAYLEE